MEVLIEKSGVGSKDFVEVKPSPFLGCGGLETVGVKRLRKLSLAVSSQE